jgi:hypothetical protein
MFGIFTAEKHPFTLCSMPFNFSRAIPSIADIVRAAKRDVPALSFSGDANSSAACAMRHMR